MNFDACTALSFSSELLRILFKTIFIFYFYFTESAETCAQLGHVKYVLLAGGVAYRALD